MHEALGTESRHFSLADTRSTAVYLEIGVICVDKATLKKKSVSGVAGG